MASARMALAQLRVSAVEAASSASDIFLNLSRRALAAPDEFENPRREDELHRKIELVARNDDGIGPRHPAAGDHGHEIGEINPARLAETDHDDGLVRRGDGPGDEGIGSV